MFNLPDRKLSKTKFDLLNKGLYFAHFSLNLNIPRIRVEFEHLYRQIRSFLSFGMFCFGIVYIVSALGLSGTSLAI